MDDVARVKEASDIVDVVGEVAPLKAKGREFVCLCPFHEDHNPSMYVVPAKQMYTCFVCGAGGDVIKFVQDYHKLAFPEALEYLAKRAGIELSPRREAKPGEPRDTKKPLLEAATFAQELFVKTLAGQAGAQARDVIERRGISREMVERFGIGCAPDAWDGLTKLLLSKRMDSKTFADAGLLKTRPDGSHYDVFRHRLMFPIRDQIGRVVAFGGRKLRDEDDPKYLNSPESPIFDKSGVLYGLDLAAGPIRKSGRAIVTEGYTDTIACHQHGFDTAVATLGTALTPKHAKALSRLCREIVLLFDSDDAGQRAADRAVQVFFSMPLDVRICEFGALSDAKDPDELLQKDDGEALFEEALARAPDLLTYRLHRVAASMEGLGPGATEAALQEEIRNLREFGVRELPPMRRELIAGALSKITGVSRRLIERELIARATGRGPQRAASSDDAVGGAQPDAPSPFAERRSVTDIPLRDRQRGWLIGWLLLEPKLTVRVTGALEAITRVERGMAELDAIAHAISDEHEEHGEWSASDVRAAHATALGVTSLLHGLEERAASQAGAHESEDERVDHLVKLAEDSLSRLRDALETPRGGDPLSRISRLQSNQGLRAKLPRPRERSDSE